MRTQRTLPLGLIRDPENPQLTRHLARLEHWNLSRFLQPLSKRPRWSKQRVAAAERALKLFLALVYLDPGHFHVPPADPDELWHMMILQTPWYHQFCADFFGFYVHHFLEPNAARCQKQRERTNDALEHWFGPSARSYAMKQNGPNNNMGRGANLDLVPPPYVRLK